MYLANEVTIFFKSALLGIGVGLLLDFFRILRKTIKHKDILVIIQDSIFSMLTFLYIFFIIYIVNDGQIRLYILLGIILSNIIYFLSISKFIINFFSSILSIFKKPFVNYSKKNKEFEKNT
ncbi:MAG: hypothetical protein E7311_01210 [Clostridiales bacterium]|nr:hypothetical protein [Clostridiales bacterium]